VSLTPEVCKAAFDAVTCSPTDTFWTLVVPSGRLVFDTDQPDVVTPDAPKSYRRLRGVLRSTWPRAPRRFHLELRPWSGSTMELGLYIHHRWAEPRPHHFRVAHESLRALVHEMEVWIEAWLAMVDDDVSGAA
jgi:hypothetical protein